MGLKVQTLSHSFVPLHEFQLKLQDISNFINNEPFDDILIFGEFNAEPIKGRFFNIFESQMVDHSPSFCNVIQLPASSFTYTCISQK